MDVVWNAMSNSIIKSITSLKLLPKLFFRNEFELHYRIFVKTIVRKAFI